MKILFLIDSLAKGGKERRMIELIRGLIGRGGFIIELVVFKDRIEYPEIGELDIPIHIIKRRPKYNPIALLKFNKICNQFRPDIIHSWSVMTVLLSFYPALFSKAKILNGSITDAPNNHKARKKKTLFTKLSYPLSDIVVSNSKAGLTAYKVPRNKGHCIPNGFDFKRVRGLVNHAEIRDRYGIKTAKVIGMVAAFAARKDYQTFVEAADRVLKKRDDVTFMAIGDGPDLSRIKNSIPPEIRDRLLFPGTVHQIESLINILDFGVLLTNNEVHGEGIPNVVLEYMALGKPVIATTGGGTDEIVIHEQTGIMITPKSPDILVQALNRLLENPEEARKFGEAGRERITEHFTLEKMTTSYVELYKMLLG